MFLRVLPYFISFFFGLIMYSLVIFEIVPETLDDIMIAISANLVGVTMIFITYELTKEITDAKLKVKYKGIIEYSIKQNVLDLTSFFYTVMENKPRFSRLSVCDLTEFLAMTPEEVEVKVNKIRFNKNLNLGFRFENIKKLEDLVNNKIYLDVMDQKTIIDLLEEIRSSSALLKRFEDGTYKESKPLLSDRLTNLLSASESLLEYADAI